MKEIEHLAETTRELLPEGTPTDLVARVDEVCIYLTAVFKNGYSLGFWSHSPWGRQHNQEKGWMILDENLEEVSSYTTKAFLSDFIPEEDETRKQWRARMKAEYGPAKRLCFEDDGEMIWKMKDA